MKRVLCFVLSLLMICTLVSCADEKAPEEKKTEESGLSQLNGEMLYRHGEDKMKALKSARYATRVLDGAEELGKFETVRVRRGYDGFLYSRSGQDFYCFDGEYAYTDNRFGAYTAPATIRVFEEYLTKYVFSVCGLNPDLLENFQRDGDTVTYESKNAELLSLYRLAEKPDFVPISMAGEAKLDEEGVILEETITLKGEEDEIVLHTVLSEYRSDSIVIAQPESPLDYNKVEDIRLPMKLQKAIETLYEQTEAQTTAVAASTLTVGEKKYVFSEDINTYAKEEVGEYYLSRQTLKTVPEIPEESIFYQAKLTGGQKTENRYNVILGEKIWENAAAANDLPWKDEVRALIPALSDFSTLSMTEEVGGYSITFTLKEEAGKKLAEKIVAALPESGITLQAATVRFCGGTLSLDTQRGLLTAISYQAEGGFVSEGVTGEYSGRYSVLVDRTEGVTLPELQVPTATTPGMVDHSVPVPEC